MAEIIDLLLIMDANIVVKFALAFVFEIFYHWIQPTYNELITTVLNELVNILH